MENKTEVKKEEFAWEAEASGMDFFGETAPVKTETSDVLEEIKEDTIGEEGEIKKPENASEEKPETISFFEEGNEDDDTGKVSTEAKTTEVSSSKSQLEFLKNKGLVDFELEDGEELTDQRAEEIVEDAWEAGVENRLDEILDALPQDVIDIIKYSKNGGNVQSYLANISKGNVSGEIDLEKEEHQISVVRDRLEAEGHDDDYITSNIDFLKDSGKLKSTAEKFDAKNAEKREAYKKIQLKQAEETRKANKENHRKFKSELSEHARSVDSLNKLKFSVSEKKELPNYIADASIKLDDGRKVTALQKDLFAALQDKDKTLMLAKILKSDFDFTSVEASAKTEHTRQVKEDIQKSKNMNPGKSSGSSQPQKKVSIWDKFD